MYLELSLPYAIDRLGQILQDYRLVCEEKIIIIAVHLWTWRLGGEEMRYRLRGRGERQESEGWQFYHVTS
jgi:hypothetical protein